MTYHKFNGKGDRCQEYVIVAVSNSNRCKIVAMDIRSLYVGNTKKGDYIPRSYYRRMCKNFDHTVISEEDFFLDSI